MPYAWIKLSIAKGVLVPGEDDARVEITVDWEAVPTNFDQEVLVDVRSAEGDFEQIHLSITGSKVPEDFVGGFLEGPAYISMPASSSAIKLPYRFLPSAGRSPAGSVTIDPTSDLVPTYLTYNFYVFTETSKADLLLYFNMTLDHDPINPMMYDVLVDNSVRTHRLAPESGKAGELPQGWFSAVQDCAWVKKHPLDSNSLRPGKHTIQIRLKSSNLVFEKLVVDLGDVRESYLGPPPSFYLQRK